MKKLNENQIQKISNLGGKLVFACIVCLFLFLFFVFAIFPSLPCNKKYQEIARKENSYLNQTRANSDKTYSLKEAEVLRGTEKQIQQNYFYFANKKFMEKEISRLPILKARL